MNWVVLKIINTQEKVMDQASNEGFPLTDDDLRHVVGGRSVWGAIKAAARWIKDHVVVTKNSGAIKGKHDIGGG